MGVEEVNVLGNVQFVLPNVARQVRVEDFVALHQQLNHVTEADGRDVASKTCEIFIISQDILCY